MYSHWLKYKHDEEIGPLLASYSITDEQLQFLKRDLHDPANIDSILAVSRRQVALKYKISKLVGAEEDQHFQRRMSLLWMLVVFGLVLVGAANIALRLGIF